MTERSHNYATLALLVAVCLLLAAAWVLGAYLESDFPDKQPAPPPPHPGPVPPPPIPPVPGNEVTALVDLALVGEPYYYRGLTVFPVELRRELDRNDYLTLDDAFRRGWVEVFETGTVAELAVQNNARDYVFAMAGEVLAGGKQNRLLREDVLLPPQSGRIRVPVYCGEQGRWVGDAVGFAHTGKMVPQGLRAAAQERKPQEEIWGGIRDKAEAAGVKSPTQDFAAITSDAKVARELGEYGKEIDRIWRPRHCGMVVASHDRIVGAEVFCNEALFAKLRGKLIESYALDIICKPMAIERDLEIRRRTYTFARDDAMRYLQAVYRSRMSYGTTPGAGQAIWISGQASGRALSFRGNAVHLCLYQPQPVPLPVPLPRPMPE
jgi:hypothetical protein